jgi:hypothetical protein
MYAPHHVTKDNVAISRSHCDIAFLLTVTSTLTACLTNSNLPHLTLSHHHDSDIEGVHGDEEYCSLLQYSCFNTLNLLF